MKNVIKVIIVMLFACNTLISEPPKFYLVVKSGNKDIDFEIYNIVKFWLPKCIEQQNIFTDDQTGVVEFFTKAKNDPTPDPFMKPSGFSSQWFHKIQGTIKHREEPPSNQKTIQKILYTREQVYCLRIYTNKSRTPIVYEMEVNVNFATQESGPEYAKNRYLGKISIMMQKITKDQNALCSRVNELEY